MDRCDVLIVGGGPAGSSCASKLTEAGLDVIILDKKHFPRDKTCAGWVTPAVMQTLCFDANDYASAGRIMQPITGFRVGRMGGRMVNTSYDQPVSFGIRRCEFDAYLLERCGARLRTGESLLDAKRVGNYWRINDTIEAKMLVGAGGHFCPVARMLNPRDGTGNHELVVAAQEIEFELTPQQLEQCKVDPAVPELYFCRDLMGYAWCFRKGNFINIGLGREDKQNISEHVERFVESLKFAGRIPHDTPDRFHGHAYILYGHALRKRVDDAVLLIGDAAGLAYPQSGEGIRTAVESGLLAASTIVDAAGTYHRNKLYSYEHKLLERFGQPTAGDGLARFVPEPIRLALAGGLLATGWFSRRVVIDRWFLHRHQPALAV